METTAWKPVKLGQIASLRKDTVHPSAVPGAKYVGLEHIDSGEPTLARWGDAGEVSSTKSRFYPGDVLYGKLRPYLDKAVLAEFEGICSTDILVLQAGSAVSPDYLSLLLHTPAFVRHATATMTGTNHPRTKWATLRTFEVSLPPVDEQEAVVQLLRGVLNANGIRRRELDLERERKAALLAHLFAQGARGDGTRETEIGEMPESWGVTSVGALFEVQQGKQLAKRFQTGQHPYPFLRTKNVLWGRLDISELDTMDFTEAERKKLDLRPGDVLVCEGGEIGRTAIWKGEIGKCSIQNHLHRLRKKAGAPVDVRFFSYWMEAAHLLFNTYAGHGNRTTIANLSASRLKAYRMPLPDLEEQSVIADVLAACDQKVAALEREIALHNELFRVLLGELMTGQRSALPLREDTEVEA